MSDWTNIYVSPWFIGAHFSIKCPKWSIEYMRRANAGRVHSAKGEKAKCEEKNVYGQLIYWGSMKKVWIFCCCVSAIQMAVVDGGGNGHGARCASIRCLHSHMEERVREWERETCTMNGRTMAASTGQWVSLGKMTGYLLFLLHVFICKTINYQWGLILINEWEHIFSTFAVAVCVSI